MYFASNDQSYLLYLIAFSSTLQSTTSPSSFLQIISSSATQSITSPTSLTHSDAQATISPTSFLHSSRTGLVWCLACICSQPSSPSAHSAHSTSAPSSLWQMAVATCLAIVSSAPKQSTSSPSSFRQVSVTSIDSCFSTRLPS